MTPKALGWTFLASAAAVAAIGVFAGRRSRMDRMGGLGGLGGPLGSAPPRGLVVLPAKPSFVTPTRIEGRSDDGVRYVIEFRRVKARRAPFFMKHARITLIYPDGTSVSEQAEEHKIEWAYQNAAYRLGDRVTLGGMGSLDAVRPALKPDAQAARDAGIRAERRRIDLSRIETSEKVDPRAVESILRRLSKNRGEWPRELPLIVAVEGTEGSFTLLDGHHRLAAALRAGLRQQPVIVITGESEDPYYWMVERDYPRIDFIELLGTYDPLIRANLRMGRGGRPKTRTGFGSLGSPGSLGSTYPATREARDEMCQGLDYHIVQGDPGDFYHHRYGYHWTGEANLPGIKKRGLGSHPPHWAEEHEIPYLYCMGTAESAAYVEQLLKDATPPGVEWPREVSFNEFQSAVEKALRKFYPDWHRIWFAFEPEGSRDWGDAQVRIDFEKLGDWIADQNIEAFMYPDDAYGYGLFLPKRIPRKFLSIRTGKRAGLAGANPKS